MTFETAMFAWNNACFDSLGVDGNGDEVTKITTFGAFVLGANAPLSLQVHDNKTSNDNLERAAMIMEAWAEALRKEYSKRKWKD